MYRYAFSKKRRTRSNRVLLKAFPRSFQGAVLILLRNKIATTTYKVFIFQDAEIK